MHISELNFSQESRIANPPCFPHICIFSLDFRATEAILSCLSLFIWMTVPEILWNSIVPPHGRWRGSCRGRELSSPEPPQVQSDAELPRFGPHYFPPHHWPQLRQHYLGSAIAIFNIWQVYTFNSSDPYQVFCWLWKGIPEIRCQGQGGVCKFDGTAWR